MTEYHCPNSMHVLRCVQTRSVIYETIVFNLAVLCLVNRPPQCAGYVASLQYVILCVIFSRLAVKSSGVWETVGKWESYNRDHVLEQTKIGQQFVRRHTLISHHGFN